jgi:hypothetical protein
MGALRGSWAVIAGSFCGSAYLLAFAVNHLLAPRFALVRMRETF